MSRIAVVNPNTTAAMTDVVVAAAAACVRPDTRLVGITASEGVSAVESPADEVAAAAAVLHEVVRREESTTPPDAYVIACFGDTGLAGARDVATGPVVGMTEAALLTATVLAHRFAVVTMPRRTIEQSDRVIRSLGLAHRCAVRAVDEPVDRVVGGSLHLLDVFIAEARAAMAQDGAEAIVLGCAGLTDLVGPLRQRLGVPVIEGVSAAVTIAEGLLAQRLATSRVGTWAQRARTTGRTSR